MKNSIVNHNDTFKQGQLTIITSILSEQLSNDNVFSIFMKFSTNLTNNKDKLAIRAKQLMYKERLMQVSRSLNDF